VAALRTGLSVFAAGFAADLASKALVVQRHGVVVWNDRPGDLPRRLAMCAVAVAVAGALTRLAAWRGLGRSWGLWAGCGLLVAGVLANGVSPLLWSRGVPDFVDVGGGWVWCLADFEIGLGLVAGIVSVAVVALVAYARDLRARRAA
jgi:hypothetical protein